jgi:tetratricopeptide (TPR) repeat protein
MRFIPPLIVLSVGFALFAGTLDNPFTTDDVLVATEYPQAYNLSNIPRYFVSDLDWLLPEDVQGLQDRPSRIGMYRPILVTTYTLNAILSEQDPFGWRLTNLVLHLLASLLVLGLAGNLLRSRLGALVTALFFVAHPVHTEAVSMLIGGRSELLAGIFVLASWRTYLAGNGLEGRRRWILDIASAFLFLLGLLSKENAVVLPGIIFLAGWILQKQPIRTLLIRLSPHLVILIIYTIFRLMIIGRVAPADWSYAFGDLGPYQIVMHIFAIQATYLRLAILPYPLQFQTCYEFSVRDSASGFTALALTSLVLGIIGIAVWRAIVGRRRGQSSFWAFCLLLFYLCLVPSSHLIPHWVLAAERFLYLPSVAICLLVGWLAVRAQAYSRWIPLVVGLPLLAACAWGTISRNADWADLDRLWGKTADCAPGFHGPFSLMGTARLRQGKPAEALPFFEKAVALAPEISSTHYNLGLALHRLGRHQEAEQAYRKALSLSPGHSLALHNLGTLLEARKDYAGARKLYRLAAKADPTHPAPYVNLGNLLQREGRYKEAEELFRLSLRIAPRMTEARFNLARLLGETGRIPEAEQLYLEILDNHPDHAMAHNNLANIMNDRGQPEQAYSRYQAALRSDPECVPAHFNLANFFMARKKPAQAVQHYTRALALQPGYLEALVGLGYARLGLGQTELARHTAQQAAEIAPDDPRVQKLLTILGKMPD